MHSFIFKLMFVIIIPLNCIALENKIIVASTTSTYDSGLLTYLNDHFKNKYNINVQILAQGTGQALRTAKDGNIEVLLVHHKESEIQFIKDGYGIKRYDLMYNDFVIVGPKNDHSNCFNINTKLKDIITNKKIFISRGDDSGTHKKEIELWNLIDLNIKDFDESFYFSVGQGMGNVLLIANEKLAYTLSDRSTWLSFNRKNNLKIICENKPPLFNQYGLIIVNPNINKDLNIEDAIKYVNWLLSDEGKDLINNFKKNDEQLFYYNYK